MGDILAEQGDQEVEARVSLGGFEGMENICQKTNFIANSLLLKPFIELILINVLIWMIVIQFSWNF